MKNPVLVVLLLLTVLLAGCVSFGIKSFPSNEADDHRRWEKAIAEYDEAIRLDPQADAYNNRGRAYNLLGRVTWSGASNLI